MLTSQETSENAQFSNNFEGAFLKNLIQAPLLHMLEKIFCTCQKCRIFDRMLLGSIRTKMPSIHIGYSSLAKIHMTLVEIPRGAIPLGKGKIPLHNDDGPSKRLTVVDQIHKPSEC